MKYGASAKLGHTRLRPSLAHLRQKILEVVIRHATLTTPTDFLKAIL